MSSPPQITPPGEWDEIGPDDPGFDPPDLDPECIDVSGMTDEQKFKVLMNFAAAVVLEQIRSMPNQNREYGALIWMDNQNNLRTTSLRMTDNHKANIAWDELPDHPGGGPDYTRIRGFVHSHPCSNLYRPEESEDWIERDYFTPADPDRLLRPSPEQYDDGILVGDWVTWRRIIENASDLGVHLNDLFMYIAGCDGEGLMLNLYTVSDSNPPYTSTDGLGGSDGEMGARGSVSEQPFPPCSE